MKDLTKKTTEELHKLLDIAKTSNAAIEVKEDYIKRINFELSKRVSTVEHGEIKMGEV